MKAKKVKVMQIRIRMYVLKEIPAAKVQTEIAAFLDQELVKDERFVKLHNENKYKMYSFDSLYTVAALGSSAFCPVKFTADDCISEHCWPKNLHQFPLPRIPLKSLKSSLIYHGHTKFLK